MEPPKIRTNRYAYSTPITWDGDENWYRIEPDDMTYGELGKKCRAGAPGGAGGGRTGLMGRRGKFTPDIQARVVQALEGGRIVAVAAHPSPPALGTPGVTAGRADGREARR
ncbi:hypothetical protein GCM10010156_22320 [Planobispora rosea]|uniref:Uncharacterized protein n=1 Tax=Planobispora rosea TaxID=35762 RepID=A0A8J3S1Y1_PLARO|nr:hypothetical protein [Planobispora rosea]GGS62959.1 hypothetical protein GCM10010156_22320 [Planobispora rosea]GIH84396.1 hypothetical protein Pro02_28040 [Planobispora rosea]